MNTPNNRQSKEIKENECSDTWISFQDAEASAWQQSSLEESRQLNLWKSTPTLKQSCDRTSQEFQFTQTSETTNHQKENSICSQWDSPAQAHPMQEAERDSNIQLHLFGEKDLDALLKLNPASVLSNNLKELSDEDFELFLADSDWQDIQQKLSMSRQQSLGRVIRDSDCLSFPTLTSNAGSTSRPAGQTKCEKWFKDNALVPNGSQLSSQAIASLMNFPIDWFSPLSPTVHQEESGQDISQEEQLPQHKQRSLSAESSTSQKLLGGKTLLEHKEKEHPLSDLEVLLGGDEKLLEHTEQKRSSPSHKISIPCLVKQPKLPEVRGIVQKDLGDRFIVHLNDSDETVIISKLYVFPDFSKSVGQIKKCSSKTIPTSTKCSSKTRRSKGEGSGHIYYRTVTRNGTDYRQAYYQWREDGKQRTKYISKKLLSRVEEAEDRKLPVSEILVLLGGIDKCSSKSSDTSNAHIDDEVINDSDECSSKVTPPSKRRRKQGEGSGWIECKPIKRCGKEYKQYWYHYEEWEGGDRLSKKSKYIPKRLLERVEKMEKKKVSVSKILEVFVN